MALVGRTLFPGGDACAPVPVVWSLVAAVAATATAAVAAATAAAATAAAAVAATTTAAAIAAATAAATTTAAAVLAGASFADGEVATTEVSAVQGFDGLGGVFVGHFDEAEAARASGLAVCRECARDDLAVLTEELLNLFFGC
jgi:hypothetical protein